MDTTILLNLFTSAKVEDYASIIEQCDKQIQSDGDNAAFYYFRAMAKMGVALSLQMNNKLLLNTIPVGIASGLGATGTIASQSTILHNKINKIENHYKIADSAVEDYNKALSLDHNIRIKYNNINVRTTSDFVGADFIFYRPISSKELLSLLAGNRKWWILLIPVVFWLILPFILLYFYIFMVMQMEI